MNILVKSESDKSGWESVTIPDEVLEAARLIHAWAIKNNMKRWALLDICSRNHEYELEQLKSKLKLLSQ